MNTQTKPKVIFLSLVSFFFLIVVLALVFSSRHNSSKTPNLDSGKYYDANSGETVSNPKGKTKDTYGTASDQPIYLGVSTLIDSGLTQTQLTRLKYAFSTYSAQSKKNIKEVSVGVDSVSHGVRDLNKNDPFTLLFNVVFDRKETYKAKVQYTGLEDIQLFLYDSKTNAQVYDSGVIGQDNGE